MTPFLLQWIRDHADAANEGDARAVREIAAAFTALKEAQFALGSHGPCEQNSCKRCEGAWDLIRAALRGEEPR